MENHGDIVYKDGAGYTHYSDGTTSYEMGGYTFYSDGTRSYEMGGRRFYDDGTSSYEMNHTVFNSDGSTSRNHISFADDLTDTLFGSNDTVSSSSASSDTGWVRTPGTYHVSKAETVLGKIGTCISAFFAGCYYAIYIAIAILLISWFSGSSLGIISTYTVTALITGIIMVIISCCSSD